MFGDLDWPLNASRGFVSISWASCSPSLAHAAHIGWLHCIHCSWRWSCDIAQPSRSQSRVRHCWSSDPSRACHLRCTFTVLVHEHWIGSLICSSARSLFAITAKRLWCPWRVAFHKVRPGSCSFHIVCSWCHQACWGRCIQCARVRWWPSNIRPCWPTTVYWTDGWHGWLYHFCRDMDGQQPAQTQPG